MMALPLHYYVFFFTLMTTKAYRSLESDAQNPDQFSTYEDASNDRHSQRSIHIGTNVQRVQEQERRRFEPTEVSTRRSENGTYKIVNRVTLQSRLGVGVTAGHTSQQETIKVDANGVIFPGLTSRSSEITPNVPTSCIKTGVCEDVPNYPDELVSKIVERISDKSRFKIEELDAPEIAQRLGPVNDNYELCEFREQVVYPRAAPDKDGKWHYILNPTKQPLQGYRVELCEKGDLPCSDIAYFNPGYKASCRQKYVLRYMSGIDPQGNIVDKPFKLPSCCTCVARLIIEK